MPRVTQPVLWERTSTSVSPARAASPRPFLKWAGGKRQLLPALRPYYPDRFGTYFEPFLGSGAVFFDLLNDGRLQDRRAVLIDNNADLSGCYFAIRDNVEEVISRLKRLAAGHARGPKEHYYRVRDKRFNPDRRRIFNGNGPEPAKYTPSLAAMLIYLNRTGFNGLFRLNASGEFNVPLGRYENPQICDAKNLRLVSQALKRPRVEIRHASFESVLDEARAGDFLYFDPPYAPLSRTALFTSYTAARFSAEDQRRLRDVIVQLVLRGCHVLLSNSTAPEIRTLYEQSTEAKRAGLNAYKVGAKRAINSNASARGEILEYVITNIACSS